MLDQRRRHWDETVQMLYKCFVFAVNLSDIACIYSTLNSLLKCRPICRQVNYCPFNIQHCDGNHPPSYKRNRNYWTNSIELDG